MAPEFPELKKRRFSILCSTCGTVDLVSADWKNPTLLKE